MSEYDFNVGSNIATFPDVDAIQQFADQHYPPNLEDSAVGVTEAATVTSYSNAQEYKYDNTSAPPGGVITHQNDVVVRPDPSNVADALPEKGVNAGDDALVKIFGKDLYEKSVKDLRTSTMSASVSTRQSSPISSSFKTSTPTAASIAASQTPIRPQTAREWHAGGGRSDLFADDAEFWEQQATIYNPLINAYCTGSHAELVTKYQDLQIPISLRFRDFRAAKDQQHNAIVAPSKVDDNLQSEAIELKPLIALPPVKENGEFVRINHGCPKDQRHVIYNGKNDRVHCVRCFNKINTEIKYQLQQASYTPAHNAQAVSSNPPVPTIPTAANGTKQSQTSGGHVQPDAGNALGLKAPVDKTPVATVEAAQADASRPNSAHNFDLERAVEAAQKYVLRPPAQDSVKLEIEHDNWKACKEASKFHSLCNGLFDALQQAPTDEHPGGFNARQGDYYVTNHQRQFNGVLREMKTEEQNNAARAQVVLCVKAIIDVHELGIPKKSLHRSEERNHRGYVPDQTMTCEQKVGRVTELARNNKYLCMDILHGKNFVDIATAPNEYVKRKLNNAQSNCGRGGGKKKKVAKDTIKKTSGAVSSMANPFMTPTPAASTPGTQSEVVVATPLQPGAYRYLTTENTTIPDMPASVLLARPSEWVTPASRKRSLGVDNESPHWSKRSRNDGYQGWNDEPVNFDQHPAGGFGGGDANVGLGDSAPINFNDGPVNFDQYLTGGFGGGNANVGLGDSAPINFNDGSVNFEQHPTEEFGGGLGDGDANVEPGADASNGVDDEFWQKFINFDGSEDNQFTD